MRRMEDDAHGDDLILQILRTCHVAFQDIVADSTCGTVYTYFACTGAAGDAGSDKLLLATSVLPAAAEKGQVTSLWVEHRYAGVFLWQVFASI